MKFVCLYFTLIAVTVESLPLMEKGKSPVNGTSEEVDSSVRALLNNININETTVKGALLKMASQIRSRLPSDDKSPGTVNSSSKRPASLVGPTTSTAFLSTVKNIFSDVKRDLPSWMSLEDFTFDLDDKI